MDNPITRRAGIKRIAGIVGAGAASCLLPAPGLFGNDSQPNGEPADSEAVVMAGIARRFMREYSVPGLSVAIARQGKFVYRQAFGFADTVRQEIVTPNHLFRIASIAKPITSVTIFSLLEKGRLKLSDLVFGPSGILQFDFGKSYPERVSKITLEHLLTHTCGGWGNEKNDPMFFNANIKTRDLIQWTLKNIPLQQDPGKQYAYSNFGYCILGRVIEKLTGQNYDAFVRNEVLAKCGIKGMRLAGNTLSQRAEREVVYYGQNWEDPYRWNVERMDSHGGWLGTPGDLVQFAMGVDGFSTKPDILDGKSIEIMTAPSLLNEGYAKGWSVNKEPNWWHGGSLPGTCTILVRTGSGLCWAAFANTRTEGMDGAIDRLLWDMALSVPSWRA